MCLILSLLGGPIAFQRGEEPILRFLSGHVNVPPSLLDAFAPNFTFPRCGAAWKDSEGNKAILKYEQNNEGEEFWVSEGEQLILVIVWDMIMGCMRRNSQKYDQ